MKKIWLVIALVLPIKAFSAGCPDYSGSYEWVSEDEESFIKLEITQNGCESARMTYRTSFGFTATDTHVFDGQAHVITEYDDFKASETATISNEGMKILEERWSSTDEADEHYFIDIDILKPSPDQVVIKRVTFDEDHSRVGDPDKSTYERVK